MTECRKAQPERWPPERRPAWKWWLLARNASLGTGILVVENGDGKCLPVFSGEGEAEMFLWIAGAFEDGWSVRETSAGELVSFLCGPCAGVRQVALDPSPEMTAETIGLVSLSRERFVGWIVGSPAFFPGTRHHARGLARLP